MCIHKIALITNHQDSLDQQLATYRQALKSSDGCDLDVFLLFSISPKVSIEIKKTMAGLIMHAILIIFTSSDASLSQNREVTN